MKKKILIFSVMLSMTFSVLAIAGNKDDVNSNNRTQYTFVKGRGIAVCEDYYKNLLSFEPREIACRRKFKPELKDFKETNWEKLNYLENKELVRKIVKFLTYGDQFSPHTQYDDDNYFIGWLKGQEKEGWSAMYFARLDINNDSKIENVVLYDRGRCMYSRTYEKTIIVIDDNKTMIDTEKTDPLLQNIPDSLPSHSTINHNDIKIKAANNDGQIYGAFSYKNKVYFDKWNTDFTKVYDIKLYKIKKGKAEKICEYKCVNGCNN